MVSSRYIEDLEGYVGRLTKGDITPLVYLLLKDTKDKKGLLEYLRGKEEEDEQEIGTDSKVSFEELFNQGQEVICSI